MKQNTPLAFGAGELATATGNAEKWDLYRDSFLKLIAEEARLQIVAGMSPVEPPAQDEDALENAVVRVECARLVYNDSRDVLAGALLRRVELLDPEPGVAARKRCVTRVADLLSEFRDVRLSTIRRRLLFGGSSITATSTQGDRFPDRGPSRSLGLWPAHRNAFVVLRFDCGFNFQRRPGESVGAFLFSVGQAL